MSCSQKRKMRGSKKMRIRCIRRCHRSSMPPALHSKLPLQTWSLTHSTWILIFLHLQPLTEPTWLIRLGNSFTTSTFSWLISILFIYRLTLRYLQSSYRQSSLLMAESYRNTSTSRAWIPFLPSVAPPFILFSVSTKLAFMSQQILVLNFVENSWSVRRSWKKSEVIQLLVTCFVV